MPQYNSRRAEVVQAIIPPFMQPAAQVATHKPADNLVQELQRVSQSDPWLLGHQALLTQREGLVWKGNRLYVPHALRPKVLWKCHDVKQAGHFGFKTLHLVRHQFWWPRMKAEIETYIRDCPVCATMKPHTGRLPGLLQHSGPDAAIGRHSYGLHCGITRDPRVHGHMDNG